MADARLAWFPFYPNDWRADPAVQSCSLPARGLWFEMLCLMHLSPVRGELRTTAGVPMTAAVLARLVGVDAAELAGLLVELRDAGVFDEREGMIVSRRMVRDEAKRQADQRNGRRGGNPALKAKGQTPGLTQPVIPGVNPLSNPQRPEARGQRQNPSCPEPAKPPTSGPADDEVMSFPTKGTGAAEWSLTAAKLAEYQQSFPGVDVLAECRKARQWCLDNPTKQKTPKGMPKFLGGWLGKVQDRGHPLAPPLPATTPDPAEIERRTADRLAAFDKPAPPAAYRTERPPTLFPAEGTPNEQ